MRNELGYVNQLVCFFTHLGVSRFAAKKDGGLALWENRDADGNVGGKTMTNGFFIVHDPSPLGT